jgi:thioredoxin reductase (NADPH)
MTDLVIIGSGPAGLAASIYASRYGLKNLVLGKNFGGTIAYAHKIDNYPGIWGLSGLELMTKVEEHVKFLGGEIVYDPVNKIQKSKEIFEIFTNSLKSYQAKAVVIATGTERRKLNIPGEKELTGKGVSYCVTCDAPFYKDKVIALIGGSDAACSGAIHLSQFAKKIYLIYRGEALRAEPFWVKQWEELVKQGKGEFIGEANVMEVLKRSDKRLGNAETRKEQRGDAEIVGGVKLDKPYIRRPAFGGARIDGFPKEGRHKGNEILGVDGVFIEVGGVPGTDLIKPLGVELDESGYVKTGERMETALPGLFCAGDMTKQSKEFKQVVWAMAQGAIAASSVYSYFKGCQAPQLKGI